MKFQITAIDNNGQRQQIGAGNTETEAMRDAAITTSEDDLAAIIDAGEEIDFSAVREANGWRMEEAAKVAAAKGGRKAARSLGKTGRKERAAKAAAARWQRSPIGTIDRFRELQVANGGLDAEGSFYAFDPAKSKWLVVWHRGNRHDIWCYRIVNGEIAERASSKGPRMMRCYLGSPKLGPENVEWLLSLGV